MKHENKIDILCLFYASVTNNLLVLYDFYLFRPCGFKAPVWRSSVKSYIHLMERHCLQSVGARRRSGTAFCRVMDDRVKTTWQYYISRNTHREGIRERNHAVRMQCISFNRNKSDNYTKQSYLAFNLFCLKN